MRFQNGCNSLKKATKSFEPASRADCIWLRAVVRRDKTWFTSFVMAALMLADLDQTRHFYVRPWPEI